jgi:hypothetical protein
MSTKPQRRGKGIDIQPVDSLPHQGDGESSREARLRAARAGSKVYVALRPCRTCNTSVRYVHGGACVTCLRVYARARYDQQRLQLLVAVAQGEVERAACKPKPASPS